MLKALKLVLAFLQKIEQLMRLILVLQLPRPAAWVLSSTAVAPVTVVGQFAAVQAVGPDSRQAFQFAPLLCRPQSSVMVQLEGWSGIWVWEDFLGCLGVWGGRLLRQDGYPL